MRDRSRELRPIAAGGAKGAPICLVAFDVETIGMEPPVLKMGHAKFRDIRKGEGRHQRYQDDDLDFTSGDDLFDFLERHAGHGHTLWVVNHNIQFDLRVVAFERQLNERGWSFGRCIFPDPHGPFFFDVRKGRKMMRFVNLANWFTPRPLREIGSVLGFPKMDVDATDPVYANSKPGSQAWDTLFRYCRRDVEIVIEAVRAYVSFVRENDLGPMAVTLAGQAMTAYRHRFMPSRIFLHNNVLATTLERESYFGGRTDVCKRGKFEEENGKFWYVDINSMYPYVMRDNPVPVELLGSRETGMTIEALKKHLDDGYLIIARCRIIADPNDRYQCCIPHVYSHKLIYSGGEYEATLTTPELMLGMERGIIRDVGAWAVYRGERIFTEYVDTLYGLRETFKNDGNEPFQYMCKILLNALYGKWGQHNYNWEPCDYPMEESGVTSHRVEDAEGNVTYVHVRKVGDRIERRSDEMFEGQTSFCAIAAHITAYARTLISHYREVAGFDNVYYLDTDSLFVNEEGRRRLEEAGAMDDHRLGALKVEACAESLEIIAPKQYRFGDRWKRKGIRQDAEQLSDGRFRQVQFQGFAGAMREGKLNEARISVVTKQLTGVYNKGRVMDDGTVMPLEIVSHV